MTLPELLANSPVPGSREPVATLTAELKNEAGALTLELSAELPTILHGPGQTRLIIDSEIMLVTAASGTKITVLERAVEGSTKAAHLVGAAVYALPTAEGLHLFAGGAGPWKRPVAWATTAALPAVTAEGELLKSTGKEVLKVDSGEPAVGARVLIKNQAEGKNNGIYEVVKKGAAGTEIFELKRTTDANTKAELQDAVTVVEKGTVNEGSQWTQTATVTTVGTTAQVWRGSVLPATTVAIAYLSAGQKIPSEASTRVKLDKVIKDPGSNMNTTEGFYVAPVEGYYQVNCLATLLGTGVVLNTKVRLSIWVNGVEKARGSGMYAAAAADVASVVAAAIVFCKAGDKVEMLIDQSSGVEVSTGSGEAAVQMSVIRVA